MPKAKVPLTRYEVDCLKLAIAGWDGNYYLTPTQKAAATRLYKHLSEVAAEMDARWSRPEVRG